MCSRYGWFRHGGIRCKITNFCENFQNKISIPRITSRSSPFAQWYCIRRLVISCSVQFLFTIRMVFCVVLSVPVVASLCDG